MNTASRQYKSRILPNPHRLVILTLVATWLLFFLGPLSIVPSVVALVAVRRAGGQKWLQVYLIVLMAFAIFASSVIVSTALFGSKSASLTPGPTASPSSS